ncbi:MAG TPA: hypothetical protein VET90_06940 [Candidatus Binatus sp.]|nr:hypothetical protein [Candidatus Binatus sp.]
MVDPGGRNGDGGTTLADFPARQIYRALLVRGLQPSEAANLTAYLAGLPSRNLHWTIPEVEAILRRRASVAGRAEPDADDRAEPQQLTWLTS